MLWLHPDYPRSSDRKLVTIYLHRISRGCYLHQVLLCHCLHTFLKIWFDKRDIWNRVISNSLNSSRFRFKKRFNELTLSFRDNWKEHCNKKDINLHVFFRQFQMFFWWTVLTESTMHLLFIIFQYIYHFEFFLFPYFT